MAIETLEDFCRAQGCSPGQAIELMKVLEDRQVQNCAVQEARMQRCAGNPRGQRRPLTEEGHEWGRVEASIPATMFYQLLQQKNFGYAGMTSDEGMRDILRDHPQCRVETVSGKTVVGVSGWSGRQRVKSYG